MNRLNLTISFYGLEPLAASSNALTLSSRSLCCLKCENYYYIDKLPSGLIKDFSEFYRHHTFDLLSRK